MYRIYRIYLSLSITKSQGGEEYPTNSNKKEC